MPNEGPGAVFGAAGIVREMDSEGELREGASQASLLKQGMVQLGRNGGVLGLLLKTSGGFLPPPPPIWLHLRKRRPIGHSC